MGESVGLEMTAKTEESHHSTSRERSIQPVTRASGVGQEGGQLRPVRGSYDLMDMALRDEGNTLNIASRTVSSTEQRWAQDHRHLL